MQKKILGAAICLGLFLLPMCRKKVESNNSSSEEETVDPLSLKSVVYADGTVVADTKFLAQGKGTAIIYVEKSQDLTAENIVVNLADPTQADYEWTNWTSTEAINLTNWGDKSEKKLKTTLKSGKKERLFTFSIVAMTKDLIGAESIKFENIEAVIKNKESEKLNSLASEDAKENQHLIIYSDKTPSYDRLEVTHVNPTIKKNSNTHITRQANATNPFFAQVTLYAETKDKDAKHTYNVQYISTNTTIKSIVYTKNNTQAVAEDNYWTLELTKKTIEDDISATSGTALKSLFNIVFEHNLLTTVQKAEFIKMNKPNGEQIDVIEVTVKPESNKQEHTSKYLIHLIGK